MNDSPTNYLANVFITAPIFNNSGIKIGSKVSTDTIQQIAQNQYVVNIDSTYTFFKDNSSISWHISFQNNTVSFKIQFIFLLI